MGAEGRHEGRSEIEAGDGVSTQGELQVKTEASKFKFSLLYPKKKKFQT